MNQRYIIKQHTRNGEFEPEVNHFFVVVDTKTDQVIMVFQQEPCNIKNRPRGDWTPWLTYNVEKVEFSDDGQSILFYIQGKQKPGSVPLPHPL